MQNIRKATAEDASRIAEILVFTKRTNYRSIFHNDIVSFGEMQVYPIAKHYLDTPAALAPIWVYCDAFVKGMIHIEGKEIVQLYVDTFFENEGIGAKLVRFACERMGCDYLWVLVKNTRAIAFYERQGFQRTEETMPEEGTVEFLVKMRRPGAR